MIQENELYINKYYNHNGNWSYTSHNGVFKFTDSDWYAIGECTLDINDINPITLTEEWLLKMGANKNRNQLYFGNGKILFSWFGGQEITLDIEGQCIDIYCEYVHQIQNLYFALTGCELEINLNNK